MTGNMLHDKSLLFAVRTVNFYRFLSEPKKEFVSGTSIGANIRENKTPKAVPIIFTNFQLH